MSYGGYGAPPSGGGWDHYQHPQGYHQYPEVAPPPAGYAPPYGSYPPPPHHYDYNQPPYHHPHYSPPTPHHDPNQLHPPHDVGTDPNSFRRFLTATLQRLSFNSKPVITNLTLFAHEHAMRMSSVLASTLEEHLKQCPPTYKLPSLYLLDSICKNIGPPYLALFGRFIERSFLNAYHVVDQPTKLKMEELLGTWRTGAPDGGELFRTPEEGPRGRVQRGIESALFGEPMGAANGVEGGGANDQPQQGTQQGPSAATPNERSGVLIDIRRLLQQRQDQAVQRPDDEVNQGQISALTQLESLVLNTQLTSDQVGQIRAQLAALTPTPAPQKESTPIPPSLHADPVVPSIKSEPTQPTISASYNNTPEPSSSSLPVPTPAVPPFDPARLAELLSPNRGNSPAVEPTPPPPPVAVEQPAPVAPTAHGIDLSLLAQLQGLGASGGFASLFAPAVPSPSLAASGEVKPDVTPAQPTPQPPTVKVQEPVVEEEKEDPLVKSYEEAILALGVGLSNKEIMSAHPPTLLHPFLYASLPLQCKQCGLRFFNSKQGQKKMDGHLDWHFTHKRRIREGAGRAQGRSWLALEEDWIHSDDHLLLDSDTHASSSTSTTRAAALAASTSALDRQALMKRKVPAPTDDPIKLAKPCPVCKEKWKAAFEEDEEEWVFWNAVEVEGVLYHATCHAEASASRASTRLKLDAASGSARQSRENTPNNFGGPGEGGGSAKKRKAEGEEEKVKKEEESDAEKVLHESKADDPRVKRTKSEAE